MSLIDKVIELEVTLEGRAPSQAGFGTPLLLGYHTNWPVKRVGVYSDPDEMLDDGFDPDDQLYLDAQILASQSPHPSQFKVGRRVTSLTQTIEIVPTVTVQGFVYAGSIDGAAWSYTVGSAATVATICTALAGAVNGLSTDTTATATTTKVTIAADDAGVVHAMIFGEGLTITDVTADTTTDDELAAINAEDPDWYGLIVTDSQSKATGILQASWIETQNKASIIQTADSDVLDSGSTTDILSSLKAATYKNTAGIYHRAIGGRERLNTGWFATILVPDPGGATPAFKSVSGVTVDKLNTGALNAVLAKNGSVYLEDADLNMAYEGKTGSGQFLDTTRGLHWLAARLRERIIQVFATAAIIPFTDGGVEVMKTNIRDVFDQGVTNGFISEDEPIVVTAPRARAVPLSDRINRRLPGITVTCALGGAIHGVGLKVTVRV